MIVVVIQARVGSSRLPGKVLMDLNGAPVLAHVLARAAAIPGVDQVCCAVPDGARDDALAAVARDLGAVVTRGSEQDVLSRYLGAARATDADVVMRVTSDCPLLDPAVSGQVLSALRDAGADYASNLEPRSYPKGLDTEAFTRAALECAAREATEPFDHEHVTPYLRRADGFTRVNVAQSQDMADWRWTLDYAEDLEFLRQLLAKARPWPHLPDLQELRAIIDAHPELPAINGSLV